MYSISIVVTGRVQGVAFRYSTLSKAKELRLSGFVKNQPDGSVYIEASGDHNRVNELLIWSNSGPSRARVDSLRHEEIEKVHTGEFVIR